MRKPIIAGNWKMNKTPAEAAALVTELIPLVKDAKCDVVVCTPSVCFAAVAPILEGTNVKLGAQNVHFKPSGAYTGELSADMLKACHVEYVIIGHSERRQYFGETDKTVNQRALAAVENGLIPIICVGEMKDEREAGYTDAIVTYQTQMALTGMTAEQVLWAWFKSEILCPKRLVFRSDSYYYEAMQPAIRAGMKRKRGLPMKKNTHDSEETA